MASGCGGNGLGAWTSIDDGVTWQAGPCVHTNSFDDRNSFWVDNNELSTYYGYMYESYNDFNVGGGALRVTRSIDGGLTWLTPVAITTNLIRNVQITGSPNSDGTVILAGMNEGGGGFANRINIIYRSTDGGASFTQSYSSPPFYPPGRAASGYFAGMYTSPAAYWRHMGWGQPGVGPQESGQNVVHYVYAVGINGSDPGNIMYIRSTNNGSTFSTPIKLNTDSTTKAQWMPSLAVTARGGILATWYDERNNGGNCGSPGSNIPCYERFARISLDNGLTWQADQPMSDVISPLPIQADTAIQPLYVGDYDYSSANGNNVYSTWVDGRVALSGKAQQDVFFDKMDLSLPCAPPPPDMIAWYPLDETTGSTADDVIFHNTGTLNGSTMPDPISAVVLGGLHFPGGGSPPSNRVTAPDQPWLNFGTGSFSADTWIRTTSTNSINTFLNKQSWINATQGWEFISAQRAACSPDGQLSQ